MSDLENIESAMNDAVTDVITKHENGLVLRWVALIETIGPEGDRGLWTFTSPDVKAWDTVGLLQHGLHLQQAQTLRGDDE